MKDVGSAGGGAMAFGPGPKLTRRHGHGHGAGHGQEFRQRRVGQRLRRPRQRQRKAMLATGGGTKHTERAVTAALVWLANHQMPDGSWSLQNFQHCCRDKTCTGPGSTTADTGATAMGLLPFLAAGQTHKAGHYKDHIRNGILWLIAHQKPDGDLAAGASQTCTPTAWPRSPFRRTSD